MVGSETQMKYTISILSFFNTNLATHESMMFSLTRKIDSYEYNYFHSYCFCFIKTLLLSSNVKIKSSLWHGTNYDTLRYINQIICSKQILICFRWKSFSKIVRRKIKWFKEWNLKPKWNIQFLYYNFSTRI
jgi:hypothetical protein